MTAKFKDENRRIISFLGKHLSYLKRTSKRRGCPMSLVLSEIIENHIKHEGGKSPDGNL